MEALAARRRAGSSSPRDQAPRLAELLDEAGHAVAVVHAPEAPPPGAVALVERSLNGGFEGGPDGLVFVTDRELFGTVRVRRPKALRRVVPRDILERLTPGDLVVHIDHGVSRYERMLRRGNRADGEDRDYLELSFAAGDKIFVPVEQINRISRYSRRRAPVAVEARRHRVAPDEAARPQGGHGPRRRAARAVRLAVARPGHAVHAGHAVAVGDGGELPVRGDARPGPGGRRGQGRHGGRPADGPARRRRRRLRQDRGRPAGRVQGDPGRQAGRGARPDDRPRRAALRDVRRSGSPRSRSRSGCCRGSSPDRAEADDRPASRTARSTS